LHNRANYIIIVSAKRGINSSSAQRIKNVQEDNKMANTVEKTTRIGDLLRMDKDVSPILLEIGMHCLGCPSSQMETIEEAAMVHGIEPDSLVERINNFLAE
jgi:hybrid cluster-associated redox disulfide protein